MIALRSSSPSRAANPCIGPLNCSSTATTPPTAIATTSFPLTRVAPTPNISRMAISVVSPGSAVRRLSMATLPTTIMAASARNPAARTQAPIDAASIPQIAPSIVISGKVRSPARPDLARSRCNPTNSPSPTAMPRCRKAVRRSMAYQLSAEAPREGKSVRRFANQPRVLRR